VRELVDGCVRDEGLSGGSQRLERAWIQFESDECWTGQPDPVVVSLLERHGGGEEHGKRGNLWGVGS
jgi:hypothetical protein